MAKAAEDQAGTGPGAGGTASKALDKRRRLEEEAKNKVRAGPGGDGRGRASCWPGVRVGPEPQAGASPGALCAPPQADEAMATYRTCVADAKTQKQELEDTKVTVLRQIQEVIRQSDQTIKSVGAGAPCSGHGEAGPPQAPPPDHCPRPAAHRPPSPTTR